MKKFKVTFYPDKKTVEVEQNKTILSAAISAGIYLNSPCGGDGVCGRCRVIVRKGSVTAQPDGIITREQKNKNVYLACLAAVHSDLQVEIPPQSRLELDKAGLQKSEEIEPFSAPEEPIFERAPLVDKLYLELPKPTLDDNISDLERLYRGISAVYSQRSIQTGLMNIKQLGELLRDADWKVTVTFGRKEAEIEVINIEPGDTTGRNFGFCFDIGTTTITGQLVDLNSGKVLGTRLNYNKQAAFGSDVITRIIYAQKRDGLEKLHSAVVDTMNQMIKALAEEHKVDLNDTACLLCSGNTTMIHLLLNVDPSYIRKEPYVSTVNFVPVVRASEAGININPRGLLFCVPGVASYVGADTTAGVISCGLYRSSELSILIDIGTNGEIAMGNREFIVACAASAGPAFEGSGLSCGMRAGSGAIQKIEINPETMEVSYNTIGGVRPLGICGSGYIQLTAQMLEAGIIDKRGRIKIADSKRLRNTELGLEFVVVFKEESGSGSDIIITEADIENLKRAKGAIYSATATLLKHMGFDLKAVKKFFIAGGFGNYLDIESAVKIGLLPDIERSRFAFIGNSALTGTRMMLVSAYGLKEAKETAKRITYFELSIDPGYMDEYMSSLFFPHTNWQ